MMAGVSDGELTTAHPGDAPQQSSADDVRLIDGQTAAHHGWSSRAVIGQVVAAIVLIIAVAVKDPATTSNWGFGVSVGAISAFSALLSLVVLPSSKSEWLLFTAPGVGEVTAGRLLSGFLSIWWGVGMGVLTFQGPFVTTDNGYFAVWIGFGCSVSGLGSSLSRVVASSTSIPTLVGLGVCALVLGLELLTGPLAVALLGSGFVDIRPLTYGTVVAAVTFLVTSFIVMLELGTPSAAAPAALPYEHRRVLLKAVGMLWGPAALWLTFGPPFVTTSNGYFALWAGMICIFKLTLRPPPLEPEGEEELGRGPNADGAFVVGDSTLMQKQRAYIWGQLSCAAVLVLATAAKSTSVDLWGYSLSVGIVALVASCTSACLQANSAGSRVLFSPAKLGPITLSRLVSTFLLLWWLVGTLLLTIVSPFAFTGNGYFAAWGGLLCALATVGDSAGVSVDSSKAVAVASSRAGSQVLHMAFSLILLIETSRLIANTSTTAYKPQCIYTLIISCLTIVGALLAIVAARVGKELRGMIVHVLNLARLVTWGILASWCTFSGPFTQTGNGYFAAWGGVLCCVLLMDTTVYMRALPAKLNRQRVGPGGEVRDQEAARPPPPPPPPPPPTAVATARIADYPKPDVDIDDDDDGDSSRRMSRRLDSMRRESTSEQTSGQLEAAGTLVAKGSGHASDGQAPPQSDKEANYRVTRL